MTTKLEHNGFEIWFDEKDEQWVAKVDEGGEHFRETSLKKLKEALDKKKKGEFNRIPIFVHMSRYGNKEAWEPTYGEAVITSVSPNGNAYYVQKGRKHSEKETLKYNYLYEDTPANRKSIEEYHTLDEQIHNLKVKQQKVRDEMKKIDGHKLFKKVYGRDL